MKRPYYYTWQLEIVERLKELKARKLQIEAIITGNSSVELFREYNLLINKIDVQESHQNGTYRNKRNVEEYHY